MARQAKRILAMSAMAMALMSLPIIGHAQIVYPNQGYASYGNGVVSGYTNYGVVAPVQPGVIAPVPLGLNLSPSIGLGGNGLAPYGSTIVAPYGTQNGAANQGYGNQGNSGANQSNTPPKSTGAEAAGLPPIAGSDAAKKQDEAAAKALSAAHAGTARPVQIGDQFHGAPRALTGDTLSFGNGIIKLQGVRAPATSALCRSGVTVWRCGQDSRDALQKLADLRPVTCIVTSLGSPPSGHCTSGRESMDKLVLEEGAAFPTGLDATGLGAAKADGRGIWAGRLVN